MKKAVVSLLVLLPFTVSAQLYYTDIMGTREINEKIQLYLSHKVATVTATGQDARGTRSSDFNEWQEMDEKNRVWKVTTRNGQNINRQYYYFNDLSQVTRIVDSGAVLSTSTYQYDNGKLTRIITSVQDPASDFTKEEVHAWSYENGRPAKMWRIVNKADSTEFRFLPDEMGNIGTEQLIRRSRVADSIFYYYNESNLLTDVVRYDKRVKRLMPDLMFEYDENGQLLQKTTILSTASRDYLIWRYILNEKGLKTKEALFNKQKELNGRIDYTYTFKP